MLHAIKKLFDYALMDIDDKNFVFRALKLDT